MKYAHPLLPLTALAIAAIPAFAQQPSNPAPLQENARPLPQPAARAAAPLQVATPAAPQQPGGQQVTLQRVAISGNQHVSSAELLAALGPVAGKSFDFAGLSALVARLSAHYQRAGYPFARAYLPQQDLSSGELKISVLEGHYGNVSAHGEATFIAGAQGFLSALPKGALIENRALERVTLLLNDQPGAITVPLMRPGQEVGSGDLLVEVKRDRRYKGEAGIDNFGSRATGRVRARVAAEADSPFRLGDQVSVQAMVTEEGMWFGSLAYATPLGYRGLRGRASVTRSFYELGGEFAALGARGTADVASLALSYPLLRSQVRNLTVSASIDHKRLRDSQRATSTGSEKASTVMPINVGFDVRDQFLHAGITYGALSWTHGSLSLDADTRAADSASSQTAGGFSKLNLDLARIQSVNDRLDLFARVSWQRAGDNLDPSEKLGLGGVNGVRAYPNGEAFGDNGWVSQAEVRYTSGAVAPFLFYDAGKIALNKDAWSDSANHRSLAGAGLGVRYAGPAWNGGLTLAWRTRGGAPQSETGAKKPTVLMNLAYRF